MILDTTRQPRPGEVNGTHYHFVTREDFKTGLDRGDFIEHTEFSGNCYGTSKQAIEDVRKSGRICLLDIDDKGVLSVKKLGFKAFYIFIQPPSLEELERRLKNRGTETPESLQRRLDTCSEAMKLAATPGIYDVVITNTDLDTAYADLRRAMMERFPTIGLP